MRTILDHTQFYLIDMTLAVLFDLLMLFFKLKSLLSASLKDHHTANITRQNGIDFYNITCCFVKYLMSSHPFNLR